MNSLPRVYEVVPARPVTSGWVAQVLGPAIPLLKFSGAPPPIEFAVLAGSAGSAAYHAPDSRVQISSRAIIFWSARSMLLTYIHEVAHRYCFRVKSYGHGPVFFGTLAVFVARIDQSKSNVLLSLDLYDMQDCPSLLVGWPRAKWSAEVLRFGLECAAQLASADIPAEDVPSRVKALWAARETELLEAEALKMCTAAPQIAEVKGCFAERFFSGMRAVIERYPTETLALITGAFSVSLMAWQIIALVQQVHRM